MSTVTSTLVGRRHVAEDLGDGQQLVAIAVAQPGQDPDYRRPAQGGACGLRPSRRVAAGVSGWPLEGRTFGR